jgi:hypothetical protein
VVDRFSLQSVQLGQMVTAARNNITTNMKVTIEILKYLQLNPIIINKRSVGSASASKPCGKRRHQLWMRHENIVGGVGVSSIYVNTIHSTGKVTAAARILA